MNTILEGILLLLLTAILQGSFAIFLGYYRVRFIYFWSIFVITALFLAPLITLTIFFPVAFPVLFSLPTLTMVLPVTFGAVWGVGLLLFGKSLRSNGIASTYTISTGTGIVLSTVLSLVFYKVVLPGRIIFLLLIAFLTLIIGISLSSKALLAKITKSRQSLYLALASGCLAPVLSMAFFFGNPIYQSAQKFHASPFLGSMLTWSVILFAACIPNILYLAFRAGTFPIRNDLRKYNKISLFAEVISGVLWFGGFILYETGPEQLGELGNAFGWVIVTCLSILIATYWGKWLGEWKNAKAFRYHMISLFFLFLGMGLIGLTLFLKK